mmetsp:Transcript_25206/g.52054  ORF Transcript_25206/g.52054 Transcript_25206/m.52054 type:complete len:431 (+) Transcript_25206:72-1364(+)
MNHIARHKPPRLMIVNQLRRILRKTCPSPSSGTFAATAVSLGLTFASPQQSSSQDFFLSRMFSSSDHLNLGPEAFPPCFQQRLSPPDGLTRLGFKNCTLETIVSSQITRSLATKKQPLLAHEWIVGGQVVTNSEQPPRRNKEVVVFLHGLLGNAKNLRTPAKKLTERLPHLSALIMDIRGHGNSSSPFPSPHNFHTCTEDIFETLQSLELTGDRSPTAIVGHSLGGRLALQYAHALSTDSVQSKLQAPKQTWVLDAVPGQPDPSVHHILRTISSIPLPIESKSWLFKNLTEKHNLNKGVAMWIASNLKDIEKYEQKQQSEQNLKGKQHKPLEWVFNLDMANELIHSFAEQKFVPMIRDITSQPSSIVNLVIAGRNKEWKDDIVLELQSIPTFGKSPESSFQMHTLPKAGHWLHVDDLNGLVDLMVKGMNE